MHICIHIFIDTHVCIYLYIYTCIYLYIYVNTYAYIFTYICMYMHIKIYSHIHTHIFIYTHVLVLRARNRRVHHAAYSYSVPIILWTSLYNLGTIVLPPGRVTADLQFAGDACEALLGTYSVRGKVALVDRGRCSFVQKVCKAL